MGNSRLPWTWFAEVQIAFENEWVKDFPLDWLRPEYLRFSILRVLFFSDGCCDWCSIAACTLLELIFHWRKSNK